MLGSSFLLKQTKKTMGNTSSHPSALPSLRREENQDPVKSFVSRPRKSSPFGFSNKKNQKSLSKKIFPHASFTNDNTCCVVYATFFEPKQVRQFQRQATALKAYDIKRLSLISCNLGWDISSTQLAQKLAAFCQNHCRNGLEWLQITGPLLLDSPDDATLLLNNLPHPRKLQRLVLGIGQAANVGLGQALSQFLSLPKSQLQHLGLGGMSWKDPQALAALVEGLARTTSLKTMDLKHCRITDEVLEAFVSALTKTNSDSSEKTDLDMSLEVLHLGDNKLTAAALPHLTKLLQACPHLKRLDLSGMPCLFQNADSAVLEAFFASFPANLEELHLSHNGMDAQVLKICCQELARRDSLKKVDLSHPQISYLQVQECLTDVLPQWKLEKLWIASRPQPIAKTTGEGQHDDESGERNDDVNDSKDDSVVQQSPREIRQAFLNALSQNTYLLQLNLKEKPLPQDSRVRAIVQRNSLQQKLAKVDSSTPLAVWPHYLANGPPALVHQVLKRTLVDIAVSRNQK